MTLGIAVGIPRARETKLYMYQAAWSPIKARVVPLCYMI